MRPPLLVAVAAFTWAWASACARPAPGRGTELPEVAAFRASLADNVRHPVRDGLKIDLEKLRTAVTSFRDEHRDLLSRTFRASLEALPAGAMPGADYGVVAETKAEDGAALAESTSFMFVLNPDATHLARMAMNMFAPVMAREAGMAVSDIGLWIGFFGAAAPAVRRCEATPERAVVCVDYGGVDVFVVTFVAQGSGWGASSVAWRQRGRAPR